MNARTYRVWAPHANTVDLHVGPEIVRMRRDTRGWWESDRRMRLGDLYGYAVDGSAPLPDPRSEYQPAGIHGLSQVIDHNAFAWTDGGWQAPPLASALMYELHVGTFSDAGTFDGAVERLDHLVDLGATHVELMPVAEFSGSRGWGYDGVDLFAPHHCYGGPDGLKRFVDACHGRRLAVLLDVVYNHLGPAGNYLDRFGPYFTERYHTPWGPAINLDGPGSDAVRRFLCDNALMWLRDYHVDGLRIDAVHAFLDTSATHVLEQLATEVDTLAASIGRRPVLIAESDLNDPRIVRSREAGGYGIDAQWSDDFHHALHTVLTGERAGYYEDFGTLGHLAEALTRVFVYGGRYSPHRDRVYGRSPAGLPATRFVVAAQNHDQIGNRAQGERLSHLTSISRVKIAAALLLMSPYVPLLFQGEEWAASAPFLYFTAHEDEKLADQVRQGRRNEFAAFGWDPERIPDPQSQVTFDRSKLDWAEIDRQPHRDMLEWYRALIALRKEHAPQGLAEAAIDYDDAAMTFCVRRGRLMVACNLGAGEQRIHADGRIALSSGSVIFDGPSVVLSPESVAIVLVNMEMHPR
jgi:maltooligosyltrehalose trehalohydrolase